MTTTICERCSQPIGWSLEAQAYMSEVEVNGQPVLVDCGGQAHVPPAGRHKAG